MKTFKDKPEKVNSLRCIHAEANMIVLEWDEPESNNSPIKMYHVYISKLTIPKVSEVKFLGEAERNLLVKDHSFDKIGSTEDY